MIIRTRRRLARRGSRIRISVMSKPEKMGVDYHGRIKLLPQDGLAACPLRRFQESLPSQSTVAWISSKTMIVLERMILGIPESQ